MIVIVESPEFLSDLTMSLVQDSNMSQSKERVLLVYHGEATYDQEYFLKDKVNFPENFKSFVINNALSSIKTIL